MTRRVLKEADFWKVTHEYFFQWQREERIRYSVPRFGSGHGEGMIQSMIQLSKLLLWENGFTQFPVPDSCMIAMFTRFLEPLYHCLMPCLKMKKKKVYL